MKKTYIKLSLLSMTLVAGFMIITPLGHLSAQNKVTINENINVHKVTVESADFKTNTFVVSFEGKTISVTTSASTTVFLGTGVETEFPAIREGSSLYLFGSYNKETNTIAAEKMVLRNKRITERSTLSRVEQKAQRD